MMINCPETKKQGKLIVVSGPSGVGKGTILKSVFRRSDFPLVMSVSATTRSPRPGEKDGIDYHFFSREEFDRRREQGDFLECCEVFGSGYMYGTLRAEVETALNHGRWIVLEIDVEGAEKVLKVFPDAETIFIMPPDLGSLESRLRGRKTESPEAMRKRLEQCRQEIELGQKYKYRIVNDHLETAVDEFLQILKNL
ncbi:MAG: guanylate kinase [Thermoguttaceae bacterium]|nr:guanylate kinase [Thermoguttaceae bacterium]